MNMEKEIDSENVTFYRMEHLRTIGVYGAAILMTLLALPVLGLIVGWIFR